MAFIWALGFYGVWWALEPLAIVLTFVASLEADRNLTGSLGPVKRSSASWFGIFIGIALAVLAWRTPFARYIDPRWVVLAYVRQGVRMFCGFWLLGIACIMWANDVLSRAERDQFALRHSLLFSCLLIGGAVINLNRVGDPGLVAMHRIYIALQAVIILLWCLLFRNSADGRAIDPSRH